MATQEAAFEQWLPVIGKALARLCLDQLVDKGATISEKATFLETLGLDRKDVADMLGTSAASIAELMRQAKKKGGRGGSVKRTSRKGAGRKR